MLKQSPPRIPAPLLPACAGAVRFPDCAGFLFVLIDDGNAQITHTIMGQRGTLMPRS
jgi:hypothetical protein